MNPSMPHLAHQCDRLQPTEALFDSLPLLLTDPISGVPRGPLVKGAASIPLGVLCHVWSRLEVVAFRHEVPGVVSLVGAQCHSMLTGNLFQHDQCGIALGGAVGLEK